MSAGFSAAAWVAASAIATVATTAVTASKARSAQKKAAKKAEQDAVEAENQSRKAETFAETEGSGIGQLGQISLEVDEDEELETSGNISI